MDRRTYRTAFVIILLIVVGCASVPVQETADVRPDAAPSVATAAPEAAARPAMTVAPAERPVETASAEPGKQETLVEEEDDDDEEGQEEAEMDVPGTDNVLDTALERTDIARELWAAGDADKAIDYLDQAYGLLLAAPLDSDGKNGQQKDDLRYLISKRLTEIYASRRGAVNGKANEIPLIVNEHVEREIRLFQGLERDFFIESYRRSGLYREQIVRLLRDAGLPEEISWLPLIESGFKVRALSRARALGLWQFIPSTGYKFGLKRTVWVDERLDPDKATQAAIAYLKELHQIFGDWATVLAAYNCGEGNVLRVIRQQKVNYLDNFWDLYERLPRETARYYPRFLAVIAIIRDPAKYGFDLESPEKARQFELVNVNRPVHLRKVAEKIGCSEDEIVNLNPELRHAATPGTEYTLRVPVGMKEALIAHIDSLPAWSPPKPQYVVHRVRRGETLSTIAQHYRVNPQRIREANNLRGSMIRAGRKLKIPLKDT